MKSLSEQSAAEMGGSLSILTLQKLDHIRLDQLLHRLGERGPDEQAPVLLEIYRLVFPHAFAEEAVLWPVIRRVLPNGHELTLRVEREHQEINELITRLEALHQDSPERQQVLACAVELLRDDVRDEEDQLLPRLQTALTPLQLRILGVAWEVVRAIAPTRAHPIVSRRPPGNLLSALPLSLLDRCRDIVDARLQPGVGGAVTPLRSLSAALARASRSVERLPGMRSGEDSATRVDRKGLGRWGPAMFFTIAAASTLMVLSRRRGTAVRVDARRA